MATKRNGLDDRINQEIKKRPIETLIRPKEEIDNEIKDRYLAYKTTIRKTFVLDPITIEAIRIFTFKNRKGLSESVIDMLLQYIPKEVWIEARRNIINTEDTPDDYLEDLDVLDIDSIYYHGYSNSEK